MAEPRPLRVGDALKKKLAKLGLHTEADLLLHLPLRYEDETRITPVGRAWGGVALQVEVVVLDNEVQFRPRRQMIVKASDGTGEPVASNGAGEPVASAASSGAAYTSAAGAGCAR